MSSSNRNSNDKFPNMPADGSGSLAPGGEGTVDPSIEFAVDTGHPAGAASLLRTTAAIRERAARCWRARGAANRSGFASAATTRSKTRRAPWPRSRASAIRGTPSRITAAGATSRLAASTG
jgi:hypothetical protein